MQNHHNGVARVCDVSGHKGAEPSESQNAAHLLVAQLLPSPVCAHNLATEEKQV